jgi:hypothetical protein
MVVVTMCMVSRLGCLEQNHLDTDTCNVRAPLPEIVNVIELVLTKTFRFLSECNLFTMSQKIN